MEFQSLVKSFTHTTCSQPTLASSVKYWHMTVMPCINVNVLILSTTNYHYLNFPFGIFLKSHSVCFSLFPQALIQTNNLTINGGTFKTISKALCNQEVSPLFFESLLPDFEEQNVHHSSVEDEHVQYIMKKYGIPQDSCELLIRFLAEATC